jgi:hypothetical protein
LNPTHHAAHEPVLLAKRAQGQHDRAAHQTEVSGVDGDRDASQHGTQRTIEDRRREPLEPTLAVALGPHAEHHLEALAPAHDHLLDHLGRILKIGVHDDDRFSLGAVDPRGDRHLVAKVPRERQHLVARLGGGQLFQQRR